MALMLNSIIGVGIFGLPAVLAERLGSLSPVSCLGAGAGILIIAACIAEVSSRYEETGGLYLYARDALGGFAGLLVAWLTWLTRIAAPAAAANLFCTYAAQFIPALGTRKGELVTLALLIGQLALLNYIGVKTGKNVSNFFTSVKVSFLLFFVLAGLLVWSLKPEIRVPFSVPAISIKNWFEAILLLVYGYGGFEGALFVGAGGALLARLGLASHGADHAATVDAALDELAEELERHMDIDALIAIAGEPRA